MKYMGSKRKMLQNGLSDLLARELVGASRFVDLFSGSGSVSVYVAREFPVPVFASDLQTYSKVLVDAIIARTRLLNWKPVWDEWFRRANEKLEHRRIYNTSTASNESVKRARKWCGDQEDLEITRAYGGYYFSPRQAVWIDALRESLPDSKPSKTVALAALIHGASVCCAAPGHTAQPFQPTLTGIQFIEESWNKDIVVKVKKTFEGLSEQHAQRRGYAEVGDANEIAERLRHGDLAFIDPPYSAVQYSRFYHVLESVAVGTSGDVTGTGRYPPREYRPRSRYSLGSESAVAFNELLKCVASHGARAIITFPDHECSNGLSGELVKKIAEKHFHVSKVHVNSSFSSLGGTGQDLGNEAGRSPFIPARELILSLKPL